MFMVTSEMSAVEVHSDENVENKCHFLGLEMLLQT